MKLIKVSTTNRDEIQFAVNRAGDVEISIINRTGIDGGKHVGHSGEPKTTLLATIKGENAKTISKFLA